jgi:adenosine deaminase
VALCTDNPTVSSTCLSREYELAMEHFHLSENDVVALAKMSCQGTFLEAGCHCGFPDGK